MRRLEGGRITDGVVRVGSTVRRPRAPSSPFVASLLDHLQGVGFRAAPRHLGVDGDGREIFTFIPGETYASWRDWADEQVTAAARLLRAFHDSTAGCPLAGGAEVVCHGEPGPNNVVFRHGQPVAFIDFDLAAPGDRSEDLAYLAWSWCLSSSASRQPVPEQARQLRLVCDAYDLDRADRAAIVDRIAARQAANADWWRGQKTSGRLPRDSQAKADEMVAWSEREHLHTRAHRGAFVLALA